MGYHIRPHIFTTDLLSWFESRQLASKRILLISSPTVAKIGKVDALVNQIEADNELHQFTAIKPDAPINDLNGICANIPKPDIIIAIGGGSVIDSAKALSIGWQGVAYEDYFYGREKLPDTKVETIAIPTTAGTGAELSYGAIIFDIERNAKGGIRGVILQPDQVVIDTDLYLHAPQRLIAETGFDCLTHAIETYLSTASTPMVRYQSVRAIETVLRCLPGACRKEVGDMEQMAIAAAMMGINLAMSTTCLPHRIQYALGPYTHTSHAWGLIVLYKGWLQHIAQTDAFRRLEEDLGMVGGGLKSGIANLKSELDIDHSLSQKGLKENDLKTIAAGVTGNLANDPCFRSAETIFTILKYSL